MNRIYFISLIVFLLNAGAYAGHPDAGKSAREIFEKIKQNPQNIYTLPDKGTSVSQELVLNASQSKDEEVRDFGDRIEWH